MKNMDWHEATHSRKIPFRILGIQVYACPLVHHMSYILVLRAVANGRRPMPKSFLSLFGTGSGPQLLCILAMIVLLAW